MVRAPIDGTTLAWARSVMNIDQEDLANAAGTTLTKVSEFEAGDSLPTLKQLEKMAAKLDRTVAFFFAPPPAKADVPQAPDFRGREAGPLPSLLAREMKRAEQHRNTVLELDGPARRPARLEEITWENHRRCAKALRRELGLTDDFVPSATRESQVFGFWRGQLEQRGYLVFQTTRVPLSDFRGLSIHHDELPIILLNGSDANNAKIFTLFHEVAHLANRTSGVCLLQDDVSEEAVANAFSANFLMPEAQVRRLAAMERDGSTELANAVALKFKVSFLAAGIRLRNLHIIDDDALDRIWTESDTIWAKNREAQKAKKGGPLQWQLRYRDLGPAYLGTIARALENDRMDLLDASYMLNARVPMVRQMLDEFYKNVGAQ